MLGTRQPLPHRHPDGEFYEPEGSGRGKLPVPQILPIWTPPVKPREAGAETGRGSRRCTGLVLRFSVKKRPSRRRLRPQNAVCRRVGGTVHGRGLQADPRDAGRGGVQSAPPYPKGRAGGNSAGRGGRVGYKRARRRKNGETALVSSASVRSCQELRARMEVARHGSQSSSRPWKTAQKDLRLIPDAGRTGRAIL